MKDEKDKDKPQPKDETPKEKPRPDRCIIGNLEVILSPRGIAFSLLMN